MTDRSFRFAATAAATQKDTASTWADQVRKYEDQGFATLFHPDGIHLQSPFAALAAALAVTSTLKVAPFVLASPLRKPGAAAWEASSLAALGDGRFEFGIGTGRPAMQEETAEVGETFGTGPERLAQLRETVTRFRALDGDRNTPIMMAAGGPKALVVAGEIADIVVLAHHPLATRADVAAMTQRVKDAAGDRADRLEFACNLMLVGDEPAPWVLDFLGQDFQTLVAHDSLAILRGDERQMAEELHRRREETGLSYFGVAGMYSDQLALVVSRLSGS